MVLAYLAAMAALDRLARLWESKRSECRSWDSAADVVDRDPSVDGMRVRCDVPCRSPFWFYVFFDLAAFVPPLPWKFQRLLPAFSRASESPDVDPSLHYKHAVPWMRLGFLTPARGEALYKESLLLSQRARCDRRLGRVSLQSWLSPVLRDKWAGPDPWYHKASLMNSSPDVPDPALLPPDLPHPRGAPADVSRGSDLLLSDPSRLSDVLASTPLLDGTLLELNPNLLLDLGL